MNVVQSRCKSDVRPGFTLVELIVVIGVIVLLAALLLPAIGRARRGAVRTALQADMQAIAAGIDAYRLDFKDIPRLDANSTVPGPFQGSAILCWALIAPRSASLDGAEGLGFRQRGTQGQVYGPYVTPGNFRLGTVATSPLVKTTSNFDTPGVCICMGDRAGNAILYYPARVTVTSVDTPDHYFGLAANGPNRYVADDNDPAIAGGSDAGKNSDPAAVVKAMQSQLPGVRKDGSLDPQVLTLPYLLWDAGADGTFGTSDDVGNFTK